MRYLVLCIVFTALAACSSVPDYGSSRSAVDLTGQRVDLGDSDRVKQILNQQYEDWHRVLRRMGGVSKSGIDCSGLVYTTYRTQLGVDVPRSTESQSKLGRSISRQQLRAGDLVFFKTGVFTRHVGMYLDNGDFLHVSSSNGVTISNLDERYWTRAYWKARRIQ